MTTTVGDGPCNDCGGSNIVWFTESVLWNAVVRAHGNECVLCIPCFVARTESVGLLPTGWRLLPDWPWRKRPAT